MRQHDDHCLLTGHGRNWRIRAMIGLGQVFCTCLDDPRLRAVFNLTGVRWAEYQDKAAEMIARREAETVEAVFRDTLDSHPTITAHLARDD